MKKSSTFSAHSKGFTLIELVLVLLISAILAATVIPKFLTNNGFSEYGYRADAIAKMRLIQLKAMQQTNGDATHCHRVLVANYQLGAPIGDCDATPSFVTNWQESSTGMSIPSSEGISFSTAIAGKQILFDSMGRPSNCGPCDIFVTGEQQLTIRVEREGYIHAL